MPTLEELTPAQREVIKAWEDVLHERGPGRITADLREQVLAHEWERIRDPEDGFAYFKRHYGYVYIKGRGNARGWQRFNPDGEARIDPNTGKSWAWQDDLATYFGQFDILVIEKTRQIGITEELSLLAMWTAMVEKDQEIVIIANKKGTSEKLVRRVHRMFNYLPDWMKQRVKMTSDAVSMTKFSNGSSIIPLSGASDTGRSSTPSLIIVDEAAFVERLEEVWSAVQAAGGEGGRVIMVSTANGIDGLFYKWCRDGAAGEEVGSVSSAEGELPVHYGINEMGFVFLPWHLHPGRDSEWRQRTMNRYRGSLKKFLQEYPSDWEEAFIVSGSAFHDQKSLLAHEHLCQAKHNNERRQGRFIWKSKSEHLVEFVDDPFGFVTLHGSQEEIEERRASGRPFGIGADVAGEAPWGDYHAASVLHLGVGYTERDREHVKAEDRIRHAQVCTIHGYIDSDIYAEQLVMAGHYFNRAMLNPETNGVGEAVVKAIRRLGYPNLFIRASAADDMRFQMYTQVGTFTTQRIKNDMASDIEAWIRFGTNEDGDAVPESHALEIRDYDTAKELRSVKFLGSNRIGAKEPSHDDRAMGLYLAGATLNRLARAPARKPEAQLGPIQKRLREKAKQRSQASRLGARQARR